jgi:hypothetical protein
LQDATNEYRIAEAKRATKDGVFAVAHLFGTAFLGRTG